MAEDFNKNPWPDERLLRLTVIKSRSMIQPADDSIKPSEMFKYPADWGDNKVNRDAFANRTINVKKP